MAEPEKTSPDTVGGAGEDVKAVAQAGPAGVVLVTIIVLAVVGIVILGFVLLGSSD